MAQTVDEKIEVFQQHFSTRFIGIAEQLGTQFENDSGPLSESGFFILSGITSYFETINQFLKGELSGGKSRQFFREGFRAVYPGTCCTDNDLNDIYDWLRNGLYHTSLPKQDTRLSRYYGCALDKHADGIDINPAQLVRDIRLHFDKYVTRLKEPTETVLRYNFEGLLNQLATAATVGVVRPATTPNTPNPMKQMLS